MTRPQQSFSSRWSLDSGRLSRVAIVAFVALASILGPQLSRADDGGSDARIEGSWLVTVTIPGGPPPFRSLETFAAGGAFVATSSEPPSAVNSAHGTWARTTQRQFHLTFLEFQYDANGVHSGYLRVRETRRLEPSSNTFDGTGTAEFFDAGFNLLFSADVTTHGTRILP
jgi:hypothetical protein